MSEAFGEMDPQFHANYLALYQVDIEGWLRQIIRRCDQEEKSATRVCSHDAHLSEVVFENRNISARHIGAFYLVAGNEPKVPYTFIGAVAMVYTFPTSGA